jgi:hypothetical protein
MVAEVRLVAEFNGRKEGRLGLPEEADGSRELRQFITPLSCPNDLGHQLLLAIRWTYYYVKMISSFLKRGIAFICASRTRASECVKPSC